MFWIIDEKAVDETRNPKAENRKKPESRNPKAEFLAQGHPKAEVRTADVPSAEIRIPYCEARAQNFGSRISAFSRPSDFESRVSFLLGRRCYWSRLDIRAEPLQEGNHRNDFPVGWSIGD